jgi:hypothetical protein
MTHGERLTGSRYCPHVTNRASRWHAVQRGSRWAFCGCQGAFLLDRRLGIKGSRLLGKIRTNRACYPAYKKDFPVHEWSRMFDV